ncbi:hypothetical protein QYE76_031248 [Lolium multiflorum]|uniref:CCHC-type domain-containing protein n=1 Tax=Lolium multiflorum TaxID=4521 RepID=A0AAD8QRD6_LOLMU|nr:hypothetical protein QYE76_031248 [Lolium multiflorum]
MEGKPHQANENRKRRMMNQSGPHHTQKHRNNSSGGFTPRNNRPPAQTYRPNHSNNNGGPPKPGGNNNNNNPNTNTGPRTGSNAIPVTPKDKSTVNCYECGVVGHYSKECPKKLAKIAANTAAPAQQRRFAGRRNQNNNNGRFYHLTPRSPGSTPARQLVRLAPPPPEFQDRSRRRLQLTIDDPRLLQLRHCTRSLFTLANVASTLSLDRRRPTAPSDPLPHRRSKLLSPVDDDDARPSIVHLIQPLSVTGTDSVFKSH